MEDFTAKISHVIFQNRQTGYCVLRVTPDARSSSNPEVRDGLTVRCDFSGVQAQVGLKSKFTGRFEDDPKYGRRFYAHSCEILPEKGRNGIIQYMQANVPSIGNITAQRLYEMYGDELVNILNTEPEKIRSCAFLQARQVDAIIKEWSQASENRTTAIYLTDLGLASYQVRNAIAKFGIGAAVRQKIQADPYCLYECPGVGFATADSAARRLGVDRDDSRRIRAMVMFAMNELSQSDGHVYCDSKQMLDWMSAKMFKRHALEPFSHGDFMSESHFFAALMELRDSGMIVSEGGRNYTSLNWLHESESAIVCADIVAQAPYPFEDLRTTLAQFEASKNLQLSDEQREAFFMLEHNRLGVVSGYPGTGKTLLISAFVNLFETLNLHYVLLSPTGIAAKRLSQVTGKSASTIHRALGYGRDGEWEFNQSNKFRVDAVIVDEMSMVDTSTFYHLMTALPTTTIVILVGDRAQLPSVGAGDVLNSLMQCPDIPHISLTRIYRQEEASDIIKVAHKILGSDPIDTNFNPKSDFIFLDYPKERVIEEMKAMTAKMKAKDLNFQVIAPVYLGDLGVDNLNLELREVLNPEYAARRAAFMKLPGDVNFFEGDLIMVVKNDYDRAIFNGEVGKIQKISVKHDEIEVKIFNWFDADSTTQSYIDKVFTFKAEEAKQMLRVAYACTAHKVQGQEFDYVLMPMTMQYGVMLYRNLIYTAITRAKKKVFIFGDPKAFRHAVSNIRDSKRNSNLQNLVHDSILKMHSSSRISENVQVVVNE